MLKSEITIKNCTDTATKNSLVMNMQKEAWSEQKYAMHKAPTSVFAYQKQKASKKLNHSLVSDLVAVAFVEPCVCLPSEDTTPKQSS